MADTKITIQLTEVDIRVLQALCDTTAKEIEIQADYAGRDEDLQLIGLALNRVDGAFSKALLKAGLDPVSSTAYDNARAALKGARDASAS